MVLIVAIVPLGYALRSIGAGRRAPRHSPCGVPVSGYRRVEALPESRPVLAEPLGPRGVQACLQHENGVSRLKELDPREASKPQVIASNTLT